MGLAGQTNTSHTDSVINSEFAIYMHAQSLKAIVANLLELHALTR